MGKLLAPLKSVTFKLIYLAWLVWSLHGLLKARPGG